MDRCYPVPALSRSLVAESSSLTGETVNCLGNRARMFYTLCHSVHNSCLLLGESWDGSAARGGGDTEKDYKGGSGE